MAGRFEVWRAVDVCGGPVRVAFLGRWPTVALAWAWVGRVGLDVAEIHVTDATGREYPAPDMPGGVALAL